MIEELARLLENHPPAVALVGAGLSTDSGIPDYRGLGRAPRVSIEHRAFIGSAKVRARYWARSMVGWTRFTLARPNAGHLALAELEASGAVLGVITQNVDGLHHAAGSKRVVELHGALDRVRCLGCSAIESRPSLQARLTELNPEHLSRVAASRAASAPDGDADLEESLTADFRVPECIACGGVLKPDVVFFGDNVPRPVLDQALAIFAESRLLLVLGSSLAVFSGFRFVKKAEERGMPVAIVNRGPTRGDPFAALRLDAPLGEVLPALARSRFSQFA